MELKHIPITDLHVATVNMRHEKKAPNISDILPSIRARGILQPLLVRPNADGFEIVAGRRRYFSAKAVVAEQGEIAPIPCAIMEPGDDAAAIEASLLENVARKNADPLTEYETFARLLKEGRRIEDIAATFGVTEITVKQRLALANLHPKIRDAYRADAIDDESIRHLTLATKAQQKEWLKLFESGDGNAPRGYHLKRWLLGGDQISTNVALFPLEDYKGHTVTDLFNEDSYFVDADLFWQLQNAAIEAKAAALREAGWADVIVLEPGVHFQSWNHEKASRKKGGKIFVTVSHRGEVEFHEGWLARKDARHADRAQTAKAEEEVSIARPQMTQAMENYIELHRHAVVRLGLIANPAVAFRLLIAHAIAPSGNWSVRPDPQRARTPAIEASIAASVAQAKFAEERAAIRKLLGLRDDDDARFAKTETVAVFAKLLSLPDDDAMRVAAFAMANTLAVGGEPVEAAGLHLKPDSREVWQPDEIFFDLIRERETINAMLAEVAGKTIAKANRDEKVKAQKQIVRDCLDGTNGRTKADNWLPGWMAFPFKSYGKGACGIAKAAKSAGCN